MEYVVTCRLMANDDYFIVFSATKTKHSAQIYAKRWQVETLLAALESYGFNLEGYPLNYSKCLKNLIFILAIVATWAVRVGKCLSKRGKDIQRPICSEMEKRKHSRFYEWVYRLSSEGIAF